MANLKLDRLNELNLRDSGSECRSDRFLEAMRLEALHFFLLVLIMVYSAIKKNVSNIALERRYLFFDTLR